MKKHIFTLIFALFCSVCAWAQDYDFSAVCSTGQTLYYKIIAPDALEVTIVGHEYFMQTGEILFSETVEYDGNTYSVTAIGDNAFLDCLEITGSLIIPNSVKSIGISAFEQCGNLDGTLTIGTSVESIGQDAFKYCNFTGNLHIPNSVNTIGIAAFYGCSGFSGSLIIPNSVTIIEDNTFQDCSGFSGELEIGNNVIKIGQYAFKDCSGFTSSLSIPSSVTTIGEYAFENCSGLSGQLTIGKHVEEIGSLAYYGCNGFTSIVSKAAVPPTLGVLCFIDVDASIPVSVPCNSGESYRQAYEWDYFDNYQEINTNEIIVFSADDTMGSVSITQMPDCETGICTVLATPLPGYKFDFWLENGSIVNRDAEYSFEATADRTLTAYFSEIMNVNSFVDSDLRLFPNPTRDIINVQCDGMKHITILNTIGQIVYETEPTEFQSAQIDLSGFDSGVFIVRVISEKGILNRQVIKTEP